MKGRKTWEQQHQRDHVSGGFNEAATPTSLTAALERLRVTVLFFLSFPSLISAQELTVAHDYSGVRELNQRVRCRVTLKPEATKLNIRWGGAKLLPRNTLTWHDDREIVMEFFSIIRRVHIGTNAKKHQRCTKKTVGDTKEKQKMESANKNQPDTFQSLRQVFIKILTFSSYDCSQSKKDS